ncbi:hypothetical protein OIU78_014905 [Salix suchowensis]|nr:hypothetical protein OIU78_014905 [Salix suchowensis]
MLAKHYYQAASAWVVFFVPASDADMGHYNELMHYLEEKQRAAVAKLDDKTTVFLVPPSDFSEKVLRVPGKLSISGVILRDLSYPKPPAHSAPPVAFSGSSPFCWKNVLSQASNSAIDPVIPEHHSVMPRTAQENGPTHFASGMSTNPVSGNSRSTFQETKPSVPVSLPTTGLQPQQLAQLASSLLGQQRLSGNNSNGSASEDFRPTANQSDNHFGIAQALGLHNNQVGSEILTSQFSQLQQMQQQQQQQVSNVPPPVRKELQPGAQGNPRNQSAGTQEEADGDPQKRLQATLQLAAALLQQIQQGKGP